MSYPFSIGRSVQIASIHAGFWRLGAPWGHPFRSLRCEPIRRLVAEILEDLTRWGGRRLTRAAQVSVIPDEASSVVRLCR